MSAIKLISIFLLLLSFHGISFSQKSKSRDEAENYFKEKKYLEAKKIFDNLRNLNPSDVDLTFKLAVCIFFTEDYKNSKKWFNLLDTEFKGKAPKEYYYFLGKILQYEYFFDEAIEKYNQYEQSTNNDRIWNCSLDKENCKSSLETLRIKGTTVSNYKESINASIEYQELLNQIKLSGTKDYVVHIATEDEFIKKWNKYNEINQFKPYYLYRKKANYRIFSSYSKENQKHKDLFIQYRNEDLEWDKVEKIPNINSEYEEDFPIYDDKNHLLYFASNRKTSFGGMDIFMIEFDHQKNQAGEIKHLDFPYNTPFDDFLYTPNFELDNAFFISNRNGQSNKYELFNVSATIQELQSIDILASFKDEIDITNRQISVNVLNNASGQEFGPFNSTKSGQLSVFLPAYGQYIYKTRVGNSQKVFLDTIDIPQLSKSQYLEQSIFYKKSNLNEDIQIVTKLNDSRTEEITMNPLKLQEISKIPINSLTIDKIQNQEKTIFQELNVKAKNEEEALKLILDTLLQKQITMENNEKFKLFSIKKYRENEVLLATLKEEIENLRQNLNKNSSVEVSHYNDKVQIYNEIFSQNTILFSQIESLNKLANLNPKLDQIEKLNENLNTIAKTKSRDELKDFVKTNIKEIKSSIDLLVKTPEQIKNERVVAINEKITSLSQNLEKLEKEEVSNLAKINQLKKEINSSSNKQATKIREEINDLERKNDLITNSIKSINYEFNLMSEEKKSYDQENEFFNLISIESMDFDLQKKAEVKPIELGSIEDLIDEKETYQIIENVQYKLSKLKEEYKSDKIELDQLKDEKEKIKQLALLEKKYIENLSKISSENEQKDIVFEEIQLAENRLSNIEKRSISISLNEELAVNTQGEENEQIKESNVQERNDEKKAENEEPKEEGINESINEKEELAVNTQEEENEQLKESTVQERNDEKKAENEEPKEEGINESINEKEELAVNTQEEQNELNKKIQNQSKNLFEKEKTLLKENESILMETVIKYNSRNKSNENLDENKILEQKFLQELLLSTSSNLKKKEILRDIPASEYLTEIDKNQEIISKQLEIITLKKIQENEMDKKVQLAITKLIENITEEIGELEKSKNNLKQNKLNPSLEDQQYDEKTKKENINSDSYYRYVKENIDYYNLLSKLDSLVESIKNNIDELVNEDYQNDSLNQQLQSTLKNKIEQKNQIQTRLDSIKYSIENNQNRGLYDQMIKENYNPLQLADSQENGFNSMEMNLNESKEKVASSLFEIKPKSSPSTASIPIGKENISGLVFRVQIGAFRKPVSPNVFNKFSPVSGDRISNGLICYMAGYFNSSSLAVQAQKQIRSLGYRDAFIVAYCDGKRITYGRGKEHEKNGTCNMNTSNELQMALLNNSKSIIQDKNPLSNNQNEKQSNAKESSELETTNQTIVEEKDRYGVQLGSSIKKLYYSVQIGVFKNNIDPLRFDGIDELIINRASNGYLRYSSGKFNSLNEAKLKLDLLKNKVSDAFIVVYYQGKRISQNEAKLIDDFNKEMDSNKLSNKNETNEKSLNGLNNSSFNSKIPTNEFSQLKTKISQNLQNKKVNKFKIQYSKKVEEIESFIRLTSQPFSFHKYDKELKSMLFASEINSPWLKYFYEDFQINKIDLANRSAIEFSLENINSGELFNHLLRNSYMFEINKGKLVIYPVNKNEEIELNYFKKSNE